jgi:Zn-dependent peptidase ImmA (M78 family)
MSTIYERPKPCGAAAWDISVFAEKIANALKLQPGAALEPVVERLGGTIRYLPFAEKNSKQASITVEKDGKFVIQLLHILFPLQERMSIAHELGHLFLHSRYGEIALQAYHDEEYKNELVEEEAYEFACGFLMPEKKFFKVAKYFNNDSVRVAAHFMVPEPVARQRMINLGCR